MYNGKETLVVFCPECGKYHKLNCELNDNVISFKFDDSPTDDENVGDFSILSLSLTTTTLRFMCENCGSCETFHMDGGISDIIIFLNKIGYHTSFSCEGHCYVESSYISFTSKLDDDTTLTPLTEEQRDKIFKIFHHVNKLKMFECLRGSVELSYQDIDPITEEFIDKPLSDPNAKLVLRYLYQPETTNFRQYEKEKKLFWKMVRRIVRMIDQKNYDEFMKNCSLH